MIANYTRRKTLTLLSSVTNLDIILKVVGIENFGSSCMMCFGKLSYELLKEW
jgi:hypothetical protein